MTLALDTTTNDLLAKLIDRMQIVIDQQREEIEILRNIQFRSGNKPTHYDITIDLPTADTFRLIFNLRFVKDNPELQEKNKELKNRVQATITAGLGANKHYVLNKVEKSNKEKTKTWQEWQFVFNACYAAAIGQRIEALIELDKIGVKGLDELATLAKSAEQVALVPKPNATEENKQMVYLHTIGSEWTKLYYPGSNWETERREFAKETLGAKVDSFKEYTPVQLDRLIHVLMQQIVGHYCALYHGAKWLGVEADVVSRISNGRTDIMNNLTLKELQTLRGIYIEKLNERVAQAGERRL